MAVLNYVTYDVALHYETFTYGVALHYVTLILVFLYCNVFLFFFASIAI